ncbi:hypothetical protein CERSUDRAFT_127377 [Gelatoporia subvermispora B]|uniref:Uncharacterized protein n=1 Tax=Ceriporiopsis subvermispora (strain B) TaxID=914234 RepID=M2QZV3_CERS8|nr:hypothetical protein CERSUDRAFT_127377 [Gelatoporia subvermispora B]
MPVTLSRPPPSTPRSWGFQCQCSHCAGFSHSHTPPTVLPTHMTLRGRELPSNLQSEEKSHIASHPLPTTPTILPDTLSGNPARPSPIFRPHDDTLPLFVQDSDPIWTRTSFCSERTLVPNTESVNIILEKSTTDARRDRPNYLQETADALWQWIRIPLIPICHFIIHTVGFTSIAILLSLLSLFFSAIWHVHHVDDFTGARARSLVVFASLGSIVPGSLAGTLWFLAAYVLSGLDLETSSARSRSHLCRTFDLKQLRDAVCTMTLGLAVICILAAGFVSLPLGAVMLRHCSLAQGVNMRHLAMFAAAGGGSTAVGILVSLLKCNSAR